MVRCHFITVFCLLAGYGAHVSHGRRGMLEDNLQGWFSPSGVWICLEDQPRVVGLGSKCPYLSAQKFCTYNTKEAGPPPHCSMAAKSFLQNPF